MPTRVRMDEPGIDMRESFFASRGFRIGLGVGHAVFNTSDNFFFRKFGIFQAADLGAREGRKSLHAALQKQLHGRVREAYQAEHHRISAERIKLVVFGDGKNLIVGKTGAIQTFCRCCAGKRMPVIVRCGNQLHADIVADPGIFQSDQLIHFGIADVELFQVFESARPHAGFVQLPVVGKRMGIAAGQKCRQQHQHRKGRSVPHILSVRALGDALAECALADTG